jgi:predicted AlkP superfamily pyrophosphatase or phosphodiesterase
VTSAPAVPTRHAVIVGIDGVRLDTLRAASTPALAALAGRGFLSVVRVNDAAPTISGPGWSTILTGVLATDHGILGNDFSPNRLDDFPDVVAQITTALPDVASYVNASWAPLVTSASGGPLFRAGGILPPTDSDGEHDLDEADDLVATGSAEFISTLTAGQEAVVFSYLGSPDEVAHDVGTGPEYVAAVERADTRLGRIVAAIDERPTRTDEEWTVIVVTDHGHLDGGGHGGDSELERTAWIVAAGDSIPAGVPAAGLEQADVAAHTLAIFGLTPVAPAQTVGRPFGARVPR